MLNPWLETIRVLITSLQRCFEMECLDSSFPDTRPLLGCSVDFSKLSPITPVLKTTILTRSLLCSLPELQVLEALLIIYFQI